MRWIILGILLFVSFAACPITLTASYETQLKAKLRFLFFSYRLAPKKEKKPKEKRKAKNRRKALPPSRSLNLSS